MKRDANHGKGEGTVRLSAELGVGSVTLHAEPG